jgi:hypothetical protein
METTTETCPQCGAAASGRFCDQCGAAISAACRECGNPLPKGARFCNMCGATVAPQAAAAPARTPVLPWAVAGVAVLGLITVLLVPRLNRGAEPQPGPSTPTPAPFAAAPQGAGNPANVDLSQMTPREAADRLFNRVMTAVSSGDTAQAQQFVPMAIMAYQRVDSLDADGRYHLAALQLVAGDAAAARAQADTILAANPTHLFGLFTAAEAEQRRGDAAGAKALYQKFLASYESEVAKKLPEYEEHAQGLPSMRQEAISATR